MFESVKYNVVRKGTRISLKKSDQEELAKIFADATDNRLTIESVDENTPLEAVQILTAYLDENFGAKQIFILPENMCKKFENCGFVSAVSQPEKRIRTTSFELLSGVSSDEFQNLKFVQGEEIKKTSEENIKALAQGSNFLKSKVEQYEQQGYSGFQLMCEYSRPFGITDTSGRLVAFCRLTDLGNNNYYLGDTFVDEHAFDDKQKGTAYLYQQVGRECKNGSVVLIAPPERVAEFENNYGCKAPDNVMFKFGGPKPELNIVFEEEKKRIELQQISAKSHGLR